MPALIIAGMEDAMYPIDVQAEAALFARNGRFEPVPGKHISVLDAPDRVVEILDDFLTAEQIA